MTKEELLKKSEALAEEIREWVEENTKLESLWEKAEAAILKLGRELGKNQTPDTLGESLAVLLPVIRQLPGATADVSFYAVDGETEETVEVETWGEADYALLTLEGLDLRQPGKWGDHSCFSERVAKLLLETLFPREIAATGEDRSGENYWFYFYK